MKFGLFCIKIVKLISTSVSVKPQIAFKRFHQLSVSKLLISWKELFSVLRLPVARTVLLQSVNRQIFNALLKEKCTGKQQKLPKPVSLLSEEENAIRYASGFIAFKLMKKFEKKDSSKAAQFVECLSSTAVAGEESSFYGYTREWLRMVDRGGLFNINESGFILFRCIELKTQACLPQHLQQASCETSKMELLKNIESDEEMQFYWSMVAVDIDNESSSQELLHEIIQLWVTIRGYCIASSWLEAYKNAQQKTTKGKKSLRKELKSMAAGTHEQSEVQTEEQDLVAMYEPTETESDKQVA